MTILIPQISAKLERQNGTDMYGHAVYRPAKTIRVGVVRLRRGGKDTSVRADSSATRGWSEEMISETVLLFEAKDEPTHNDRVTVNGWTMKINAIEPRYDLLGNLAHWQVGLEAEVT